MDEALPPAKRSAWLAAVRILEVDELVKGVSKSIDIDLARLLGVYQ